MPTPRVILLTHLIAPIAGGTLTPPAAVASLTLAPSTLSVVAGSTTTLTATPRDASSNVLAGRVVTWASSNTAVARVSGGLVTGVAAGTATITATCEGVSATSAATVTAAVSSDVVYATRLTRRVSGDITTATPLTPAVVSAIAAAGMSQTGALRLVVASTGAEIPVSAPTLLDRSATGATSLAYTIREVDLPSNLAVGGSVLTELRWGPTTPATRRTGVTALAVPNGSNWPERAGDLCDANLWGLPLVPYAQRGTVPSTYARLDDNYPAEHANDETIVAQYLQSDFANTVITFVRSGGQLMNDPEGQMVSEGCRRGGTVGHGLFHDAIRRMDLWDTNYADAIYQWTNEWYPRPLSHPCLYWLTGCDLWRQRTMVTCAGQVSHGRQDLWQDGTPSSAYATRTQQELRPLADTLFAIAAAQRLTADRSSYPNAIPDLGLASTQPYWSGLAMNDGIVAGVLGMQWAPGSAYAGSWGGRYQTADANANAPQGTPCVKSYEAHLFHSALIALYHMGHFSDARRAQLKAAVVAGTRYLNTHAWRPAGTNGPCAYYDYVWPVPGVTSDPPTPPNYDNGHPVENDSGNGQYEVTVETTTYAGLPNAWCWSATGDTAFRDRCDAIYATTDDNRYADANRYTNYYLLTSQVKKQDQAHIGRASMLAFRFGNITPA